MKCFVSCVTKDPADWMPPSKMMQDCEPMSLCNIQLCFSCCISLVQDISAMKHREHSDIQSWHTECVPKFRPTIQCQVGLYFLSNSFLMKAAMSFSILNFSSACRGSAAPSACQMQAAGYAMMLCSPLHPLPSQKPWQQRVSSMLTG